ncbi:MAG: CBS domain-containing protein [Spirochaetaceae bacterium]|jgi:tRNA nucleotidyltransferase (CCA-adding enzyme)|nr:CBS domain-containing protein [Spirochaetaceae bacterium]
MNIAFGHTNMDLDCFGSLILVKRMFPDFALVRSNLIHPAARTVYDFYSEYFEFLEPQELEGRRIDRIIIVDTSRAERVKEYFNHIRNSDPEITVIDHHPRDSADILGAQYQGMLLGSNTSFLSKLAREKDIQLRGEEATIALTGIYADTGQLIYENVRREDYEAAAYCLEMGASLKLVKSFLETIKEDRQMTALHELLRTGGIRDIQGHSILLSYLELDENIPGLAAVVEKIMSLENPDAYFAVFFIPKNSTALLIARSQKPGIDLHELLSAFGGGGHQMAGSAKMECRDGRAFLEEFTAYLEKSLTPATRARDIMTRGVHSISENASLLEASRLLESIEHTGVPVLDSGGVLTGFISLRDIMKGRKAALMQAPVKAFMSRNPVISDGSHTMREIERIFFKHRISHLPVVEDGKLSGLVTRWDYLQHKKNQTGGSGAIPNAG